MATSISRDDQRNMRNTLFYSFLALFIVLTILTILSLFFGVTRLKERYESTLMTTFILEVGAGVIALFYLLFGLRKQGNVEAKNNTRLRIYVSATENGLVRGSTYFAYYEILDEESGNKNKIENVHTQWEVDGSLGFTIKNISDDIFIMFGIIDKNGTEWISDHFKPGNMRFQKLNQLN